MEDVAVDRGGTKALTKVVTTPDQDPRLLGRAALLFGKEICSNIFVTCSFHFLLSRFLSVPVRRVSSNSCQNFRETCNSLRYQGLYLLSSLEPEFPTALQAGGGLGNSHPRTRGRVNRQLRDSHAKSFAFVTIDEDAGSLQS